MPVDTTCIWPENFLKPRSLKKQIAYIEKLIDDFKTLNTQFNCWGEEIAKLEGIRAQLVEQIGRKK